MSRMQWIMRCLTLGCCIALPLFFVSGCAGKASPTSSNDTPESKPVLSKPDSQEESAAAESEAASAEASAKTSSVKTSGTAFTAGNTTATSPISSSEMPHNTGSLGSFLIMTPVHGALLDSTTLTAKWTKSNNAESYTLVLEQYRNGGFSEIKRFTGLTGLSYTIKPLVTNATYRWNVYAVNSAGKRAGIGGNDTAGNIVMSPIDVKNHPANQGLSFDFDGSISKEVLCNYLSRAMTVSGLFDGTADYVENNLRMLYNTGVKYVGRAGCNWGVNKSSIDHLSAVKKYINQAHTVDSALLFEACIFEFINHSVEEVAIPSWVFEAFGKTPETRSFRYDAMCFPDGTFKNHWGTNASVPDITQTETQMFFYFLGRSYIDAGFEALHMGQVHLIGAHDTGWQCYTRVNNMIRDYAKQHARRHFVMINAHSHGITDAAGKLMFDFHQWPMRGKVPDGSVAHRPTEDNPQRLELKIGYGDAIYLKSMGGTTYSGWSCSSLPYTVEIDNYADDLPNRNTTASHWGYDEISWYANQPASYRHQWLSYAYTWVHNTDRVGYFMMPGVRTARIYNSSDQLISYMYYNYSTLFSDKGFDDEFAIRDIFVNSR